jgi:hypothetical protein
MYDHFGHSALLVERKDPVNGQATHRAMLEYMGDKVEDGNPGELVRVVSKYDVGFPPSCRQGLYSHKRGLLYRGQIIAKSVPAVIGFTQLDASMPISLPPSRDKRLYETFEWNGHHWTKQRRGEHLKEEHKLQDWEQLVQDHVKNQPPYRLRDYVCHNFQEGIRSDLGFKVPPDTARTRFFRNVIRPVVGTLIGWWNASTGSSAKACPCCSSDLSAGSSSSQPAAEQPNETIELQA